MDNATLAQIDVLIERSGVLLTHAEQEAWEVFSHEVEEYSRQLNALGTVNVERLDPALKEAAVQRLEILLAADATLRQCIQARLHSLSADMASLRKSRASANAYTAV